MMVKVHLHINLPQTLLLIYLQTPGFVNISTIESVVDWYVNVLLPSYNDNPLPVPNQVKESLISLISATTLLLNPSSKKDVSPSVVDFKLYLKGLVLSDIA